jgi:hypothetical protein
MGTIEQLAADLDAADAEAVEQCRKVVSRGCLNVKNWSRGLVDGYAHLPHYPSSITYDTKVTGDLITGTVGPERARRQGKLGDIIENGSINNAPIPHLNPALDAEEPGFLRAAEDLAEKLLGRR